MTLPTDIGAFHFVGIGGIGMSGIAELLVNLGYKVQGSDIAENANVIRMREKGIKVFIGHAEENVDQARVVVVSTAVKKNNPEVLSARSSRIPVIHRSEMLAELMRLKSSIAVGGTHGKTTTTSLVSAVLDAGGQDPTVINGGIINTYGSNARMGSGEWLVAEADESDGSFLRLPAEVAIVTNIDPEHLDHYGSFDALRKAFDNFIQSIPFYGFAAVCFDNQEGQALVGRINDREVITYGFNRQSMVRVENVKAIDDGVTYDVVLDLSKEKRMLKNVFLPMFGEHNILNSLAAITVGVRLGLSDQSIKDGLKNFKGVKRRFTLTGEVDGIRIIDDYGHHPTEISAVLKAARSAVRDKKLIAIVQPHRYSRLRDLFVEFSTCFDEADTVLVTDVYPAGEQPIKDINKLSLATSIAKYGHKSVQALESHDDIPKWVNENCNKGDMVVFLGAGSISLWANELPDQLSNLKNMGKAG